MKTFLVHLKAGGKPLTFEAIRFEAIDGKIYFFKDEGIKDRSLFVDENVVSAITEGSDAPPAQDPANKPLKKSKFFLFLIDLLDEMFSIDLNASDIPIHLSFQERWKRIEFWHPIIWGAIGFLLLGIVSIFTKDFGIVSSLVKSSQWGLVLVADMILLFRLVKNKERRKTVLGKSLLAVTILVPFQ